MTLRNVALLGLSAGAALGICGEEPPAVERQDGHSRNPLHESGSEKDHLTGDWGGRRTTLVERGIHFQFGYIAEGFYNVDGGVRRGAEFESLGEVAAELDLDRLVSWRGATFRASGLWLAGRGPSRLAGDVLTASNIDGYDSVRLYELWLQQTFRKDVVSLRAGALLADEEFTYTDSGSLLLNSAFGWPAFISGNVRNTGPAFYVTALGARLRVEASERWFVQGGIFDGDTFDSDSPHRNESGTHFEIGAHQGAFGLGEVGWRWNQHEQHALPGVVKLGTWFRFRPDNVGGYIAGEQKLWHERGDASQGLGAFFRVGVSRENRSAISLAFDTGLFYSGLIPGRDEDKTALGLIHADFGKVERLFSDYEQVLELTHEFVMRPWWSIQPDLQWINDPGGKSGPRDAFLLGLRTSISF